MPTRASSSAHEPRRERAHCSERMRRIHMLVRIGIAVMSIALAACVVGDAEPERPRGLDLHPSLSSQPRPDLNPPGAISDGDVDLKVHWIDSVGDTMVIAVSNQGSGDARGFYVDFFIDLHTSPTFGTFSTHFAWVPGLPAGTPWIVNIEMPGITSWSGWFDVLLDSDQFVPETDEGNNLVSVFSPCCYPHWTGH
jgi:hypothetical protein